MSLEAAILKLGEEINSLRWQLAQIPPSFYKRDTNVESGEEVPAKNEKPAADKPKAEKSSKTSTPAKESEPTTPKVTAEDVKLAAREYANVNGREAAIALLAKFGVKVSKDLPEKDWVAFIAAASASPEVIEEVAGEDDI